MIRIYYSFSLLLDILVCLVGIAIMKSDMLLDSSLFQMVIHGVWLVFFLTFLALDSREMLTGKATQKPVQRALLLAFVTLTAVAFLFHWI